MYPLASEPSSVSRLSRRQQALYRHLRTRAERGAAAPSLDELCHELGLRSRGSLHKQIQALIEAGLVEPMQRRRTGIHLTQACEEGRRELPLLGYIAAGRPLEAVPVPEPIVVPDMLVRGEPSYVLQVRGDSMIEAGILPGTGWWCTAATTPQTAPSWWRSSTAWKAH